MNLPRWFCNPREPKAKPGPAGTEEVPGVGAGVDGGAEGDRTPDFRLAKPALSQLSYSPVFSSGAR